MSTNWMRRNVASRLPVAVKLGVPVVAISIFAVALLGAVCLRQTRARIGESYSFQSQGMTRLIETQYRLHPDNIPAMNAFLKGLVADHPSLIDVQLYRQGFGGPAYIWSSSNSSENTEPISSNVLVP